MFWSWLEGKMLAAFQHLALPELSRSRSDPYASLGSILALTSKCCGVQRDLSSLHHPRSQSSHAGPYRDPSWAAPRLQLIREAEVS